MRIPPLPKHIDHVEKPRRLMRTSTGPILPAASPGRWTTTNSEYIRATIRSGRGRTGSEADRLRGRRSDLQSGEVRREAI